MLQLFTLSILLLCSGFDASNQESTSQSKPKPCSQYKQAYEDDKDSGLVKVYEAGARDWSKTYARLMKANYNVEIIETDMFGLLREMHCYNTFSIPYIKDQFGDSVFVKTTIEANRLDAAGLGDRLPSFIIDSKVYETFFYERIDPELYKSYLKAYPKLQIYCHLYIDSTGRVTDLHESSVKGKPLDKALIEVAKELPFLANPALEDAQPTNGVLQLFLYFSKETQTLFKVKE